MRCALWLAGLAWLTSSSQTLPHAWQSMCEYTCLAQDRLSMGLSELVWSLVMLCQ